MLNKDNTLNIKGIAIIFVIIAHTTLILNNKSFLNYLGSLGVTLFLFISGYGLTKSYVKNGIDNFFKKRLSGVFIPYFLITIFKLGLSNIYGLRFNFKEIFLSLIGFDLNRTLDPTMWYISFILIWYILFYFIFKNVKYNNNKIIAMFIISIIFVPSILFKNSIGSSLGQWTLNFIAFPIGVFYAFREDIVNKYLTKFNITLIGIISVILYSTIFYKQNNQLNIVFNMGFDLLFAFVILGIITKIKFNIPILKKAGDYSYELYLIEGYFLYIINVLNISNNKILSIIVYLAIIVVISMILKPLNKIIKDRLLNNNKMSNNVLMKNSQ